LYELKNVLLFLAPEQLQWQAQELGVLIHFNIATYIEVDGCSGQMVPNISLFNPYMLNTDNWVQTMIDFGAQYAVLVGKVRIYSFCFSKHQYFFFV
jgi:alpha-L-fucosidase